VGIHRKTHSIAFLRDLFSAEHLIDFLGSLPDLPFYTGNFDQQSTAVDGN